MLNKISMRNLAAGSMILAVTFLSACSAKKVTIGAKDEVSYEGSATKQEAEALGAALKTNGYFKDLGYGVVLSKGSAGTTVSFVVQDGIWDDATQVQGYTMLGRLVAPSIGGLPLKVLIVNTHDEPKKEIPLS